MIITDNTLTPFVDNGEVINIDGTVDIQMEAPDIQALAEKSLCDTAVSRYVNQSGVPDDIKVQGAKVRALSLVSLWARPWPELTAKMRVEQFEPASD